jgi:putative sporulation protein YtxC
VEWFTLLVEPTRIDATQLTEQLRRMLGKSNLGEACELRQVPLPGGTGIVCDMAASKQAKIRAQHALHQLSSVLAEAIIQAYEDRIIAHWVYKQIDPVNQEAVRAIAGHCRDLLGPSQDTSRFRALTSALETYFTTETFLNIEGFIRFRASGYSNQIKETVTYAVDEWIVDRQYQEFISLLKYFVDVQEAKVPFVHLVHRGNQQFMLLNAQLQPLERIESSAFALGMVDQELHVEDVIVSTLIHASPGKLYIHTSSPDQQVIRTIATIFDGRAEICRSCSICIQNVHFPLT